MFPKSMFVAHNAVVVGDVTLGQESSVWFGAVIRGDSAPIAIGNQSNVQDLCLLHADEDFPCTIGNRCTLGHAAIVHGATVEDDCLIGIRATILNGAIIGRGSLVAAGTLVPEGKIFPPGSVLMGSPAKVVRSVTAEDTERIQHAWQHYVVAAKQAALSR